MRGLTITDIFVAVITVAVLYVLVRPRSKGAEMVTNLSNALASIITSATDLAGG